MTSERIEPCPFCQTEIRQLELLDKSGFVGFHPDNDCVLIGCHIPPDKLECWNHRISRPSSAPSEEMVEAGRVAYSHFRQTIERDVLFCDLTSEEQEELATRIYDAMNRAAINVISGEQP